MTLTAADVAEIMRLVEQSGFDELNLEVDGMKLSLRRGGAANGVAEGGAFGVESAQAVGLAGADASKLASSTSAQRQASSSAAAGPASTSGASSQSDSTLHDVASPLLGTFYRAPKPGAEPFVDVGSLVEENTVVAIIEVMKLMNTVRAGVRGTVTEILLTDGALAEYGQPLLRVRKAG